MVDASVWLSHLLGSDSNHRTSSRWLGRQLAEQRQLFCPAIALAEVAGAMARETDSDSAGRKAAEFILGLANLSIVDVDGDLARAAYEIAAAARLRGMDAIYVALSRTLSLPLVSWDVQQIRRGGAVAPSSRV
ncbi:MAG TPA: PIN domain-containing protein [Dehalococcoidia bacterium]